MRPINNNNGAIQVDPASMIFKSHSLEAVIKEKHIN